MRRTGKVSKVVGTAVGLAAGLAAIAMPVLWRGDDAAPGARGATAATPAAASARGGASAAAWRERRPARLDDDTTGELGLDDDELEALVASDGATTAGQRFAERQQLADDVYRRRAQVLLDDGVRPEDLEAELARRHGDVREQLVLDTLPADDDDAIAADLLTARARWSPSAADLEIDRQTHATFAIPEDVK